jgi:CheY-like chemotaxis protein
LTHNDTQQGTILVGDDNSDIRTLTTRLLEVAGYIVLTAADGEEAFRFYEEHQSSIVLLLTDVAMPNMDGIELIDRVLGIDSRLPMLLMSGEPWGGYRGLECVSKPFRPAKLIESVSRAIKADTRSERTVSAAFSRVSMQ